MKEKFNRQRQSELASKPKIKCTTVNPVWKATKAKLNIVMKIYKSK